MYDVKQTYSLQWNTVDVNTEHYISHISSIHYCAHSHSFYLPIWSHGCASTCTSQSVRNSYLPGIVMVTYCPCMPAQLNDIVSPRPMLLIVVHLPRGQIVNELQTGTTGIWVLGFMCELYQHAKRSHDFHKILTTQNNIYHNYISASNLYSPNSGPYKTTFCVLLCFWCE